MSKKNTPRNLFGAIDRAKRWVFVRIYPAKAAAYARFARPWNWSS